MDSPVGRRGVGSEATPREEYAGWWLCPPCGALHDAPTCRAEEQTDEEVEGPFDSAVHLCACCCRVPVRHTSPSSSFLCGDCGPPIIEVNRRAKRLVVPVCADRRTNCALILPPDRDLEEGEVTRASPFFDAQLDRLAMLARIRVRYLCQMLRLPWDDLMPLESYVRRVAELRADQSQPAAARNDLLGGFAEYVLSVPAEDPVLAARIVEEAKELVRKFPCTKARDLLDMGRAALHEAARLWAWDVVDEVLPIPPYLPAKAMPVLERRSHTIIALSDACIRTLRRTHGPEKCPPAPHAPEGLLIVVPDKPGEPWPDGVPEDLPVDADLVVGLEDTPAIPGLPLGVYHLTADGDGEQWVLWADVADEAEDEFQIQLVPTPAAWCPATGLSAADGAFLLLEALLARDRASCEGDCPRPRVGFGGLLSEDLADVLLDRVWQVEEA